VLYYFCVCVVTWLIINFYYFFSAENETLARIGSTCLQQFIENNVDKMDESLWDKICDMFVHLFKVTTPDALFFDYREQTPEPPAGVIAPPETFEDGSSPLAEDPSSVGQGRGENSMESNRGDMSITSPQAPINSVVLITSPTGGSTSSVPTSTTAATLPTADEWGVPYIEGRRRPQKSEYQGIIVRCVLHLLVIQTLQELLCPHLNINSNSNTIIMQSTQMQLNGELTPAPLTLTDKIFRSLTQEQLFVLVDCLERSFRFAKAFNSDMDLRVSLYKMGFMKQLPNLLKQETGSVGVVIGILMRMFGEEDAKEAAKDETITSPEVLVGVTSPADRRVEKRLMP
jgi:brefeldin A-inhibited guanine nucleotide-exchange protein